MAARKSDMDHLEMKLEEFGKALAEVREMIASKMSAFEAWQHQATGQLASLSIRDEGHDKRLANLEDSRARAEGAATGAVKLGKVIWAAVSALAAVAAWYVGRVLR